MLSGEFCTKSAKHQFSADILKYFPVFPLQHDLTFYANCL